MAVGSEDWCSFALRFGVGEPGWVQRTNHLLPFIRREGQIPGDVPRTPHPLWHGDVLHKRGNAGNGEGQVAKAGAVRNTVEKYRRLAGRTLPLPEVTRPR